MFSVILFGLKEQVGKKELDSSSFTKKKQANKTITTTKTYKTKHKEAKEVRDHKLRWMSCWNIQQASGGKYYLTSKQKLSNSNIDQNYLDRFLDHWAPPPE